MNGGHQFIFGLAFAFFIQYHFDIIKSKPPKKPKIPGGQLWIYKNTEQLDSLLYIFAGSARHHNWEIMNNLVLQAVKSGHPDWKLFNPDCYVIRDYPD